MNTMFTKEKAIQALLAMVGGAGFLISLHVFQNKNWIIGGILIIGEVVIVVLNFRQPKSQTSAPVFEVDSDLLKIVIEEVVAETLQPAEKIDYALVRRLILDALGNMKFELQDGTLTEKVDVPDWLSTLKPEENLNVPTFLRQPDPEKTDKPRRIRKVAGK
jgi:hypothetical protein